MGTYLYKDGEEVFVKKAKQVKSFLEAGYSPTNEPVKKKAPAKKRATKKVKTEE